VHRAHDLCESRVYTVNTAWNSLPVTLINIYNAPAGSTNANEAINTLLSLPPNCSPSTFLAGDLNLYRQRWNPTLISESPLTVSFTDWLDQAYFTYTAQPGVATHIRGNVLDLAFISGPYTASTSLAEHLQVTSDHSPLLTTINWDLKHSQSV
jgi:endonuclease/exonuclease/phosphatase family metal-dependent hydrolase